MTTRDAANSFCEKIASVTNDYKSKTAKSEIEMISLTMLHMGCDKMMSIISLLNNGIEMNIKSEMLFKESLFSPFSIARSLYELMLIHHSLFVNTKSKEEMEIFIDLWKIKGYTQREKCYDETFFKRNPALAKQVIEQKERDKESINKLVLKVKESSIYNDCKDQFDHAFKTDKLGYFEIKRNNAKVSLSTIPFGDKNLFCRIYKDMEGLADINNDLVYNYLSLNSHPSYISVLQFLHQGTIPQKDLPLESALLFVYRMIKSHDYLLHRLDNL